MKRLSYSPSHRSENSGPPSARMIAGIVLLCPTTRITSPDGRARTALAVAWAWAASSAPAATVIGVRPSFFAKGAAVERVRRNCVVMIEETLASLSAEANAAARANPASLSSGSGPGMEAFSACLTRTTMAGCAPAMGARHRRTAANRAGKRIACMRCTELTGQDYSRSSSRLIPSSLRSLK